jgi:hypothetical protein
MHRIQSDTELMVVVDVAKCVLDGFIELYLWFSPTVHIQVGLVTHSQQPH